MNRQQGFSLIEIMIAITLSLVILLGIVQLFTNMRAVNASQAGLADLHESARFGISTLVGNIRMANNWPIIGDPADIVRTSSATIISRGSCDSDWAFDIDRGIEGFDGSTMPDSTIASCIPFTTDYVPDSDILIVRHASNNMIDPALTLDPASIFYRYNNDPGTLSEAILLDGNEANNIPIKIDGGIPQGVQYLYNVSMYYLRRCDRPVNISTPCGTTNNNRMEPTLARLTLRQNQLVDESIATGVEQIRYRYGVDTNEDGVVNRYVSAGIINTTAGLDWDQVVSVEIDALVRSPANSLLANDNRTFNFINGKDVSFAGTSEARFDRQQIRTSIRLRNARRYDIPRR